MIRWSSFTFAALLGFASLSACGGSDPPAIGPGAGGAGAGTSSSSSSSSGQSSTSSSGQTSSSSSSSSSGQGGQGGGPSKLETILAELRKDRDGTMLSESTLDGWPVAVEGGWLFVSTDAALTKVAGDHDAWAGTPMKADQGFSFIVLTVPAIEHYKFTDGTTFAADPFARSYQYDQNGEISLVAPAAAHLDRFLGVGDAKLVPRPLHIRVPAAPITRVLYVHDGQNLFDPSAPWGGWQLDTALPAGVLAVGIDNSPDRMNEYTHVQDDIGNGPIGGWGDIYGDFLEQTVRPLVQKHYGEKGPIGVMGSSLGGLIALHIADRFPGHYAFAASLSGTMGWGSIGAAEHNQTMIERYKAHGHQGTVLYVDSGGNGTCFDSDNDGIMDDDPNASDNYCENAQLRDTLLGVGYVADKDFVYFWQPGAMHNEAEWAKRVSQPLGVFAGL